MRNPLAAIERYQSPLVRDLAWALLSPALLNSSNGNHNPSPRWYLEAFLLIESHLESLDRDDAPLQHHLTALPNHRLGLYFERLWSYWLMHNGRYELLAHNLQVIEDHQTLGEFDFIVRDTHADQIEHWELAVKFYLGIPPLREASHWFGTNSRDRLDLKYCHLVDKQLTLSETFPGRRVCQAQGWNINQRRLISKGRLYYPYTGRGITTSDMPRSVDPGHLTGFWLSQSAFLQQAAQIPDARFHRLDRTEWLAHHTNTLQPLASIQDFLEQQLHPRPLQFRVSGWQAEPFRLFVVPDTWQADALATLSNTGQQ